MESHTTEPQFPAGAAVPAPLYPPTADPPRPLRPLAITAMIALGLVTLANLSALWVDVIQLGLATDLESGRRVSFDELSASDDRVAATGLLQTACYVLCVVAFLAWYGRAYRNLGRLGARGLRWGNGWAIAYWFIPIANLFRPKQVVNDIWRASDPGVPQGAGWGGRVPAVIHWWWALWLISSFAERILFRRSMEAGDSPSEFVSLSQTYIVWDLIDVIPAALAFLVVRKITARQEERRRRFERGELPTNTPAPPEPEPDLPIPTDLPPPKTLAERLS
jgi:eukaryotic-like serine/threonine-protein kinase